MIRPDGAQQHGRDPGGQLLFQRPTPRQTRRRFLPRRPPVARPAVGGVWKSNLNRLIFLSNEFNRQLKNIRGHFW